MEGQKKEEEVEEVLGVEAEVGLTWVEGEVEQTLVVEEVGLWQAQIWMMEVVEGQYQEGLNLEGRKGFPEDQP